MLVRRILRLIKLFIVLAISVKHFLSQTTPATAQPLSSTICKSTPWRSQSTHTYPLYRRYTKLHALDSAQLAEKSDRVASENIHISAEDRGEKKLNPAESVS